MSVVHLYSVQCTVLYTYVFDNWADAMQQCIIVFIYKRIKPAKYCQKEEEVLCWAYGTERTQCLKFSHKASCVPPFD